MGISYVIIQTDSKINFLCSSKAELCLQWRVFPKKLLDPQIRNVTQESGSDCSLMQKRHHNNMRLFLLTNSVLLLLRDGTDQAAGVVPSELFLLSVSCSLCCVHSQALFDSLAFGHHVHLCRTVCVSLLSSAFISFGW